jgi:adenylylsulfate kinase-like enzyme
MIYWFTGQPGHGKTVLAKMLKDYLEITEYTFVFHIDGDDLREILTNKDYSKQGRENNIKTAHSIARYLDKQGYDVVVSLVSPYRELREEFKLASNFKEIYVHTSEIRGREQFHVSDYEPPLENYIDADTTDLEPEESLNNILKHIYGE